VARWKPDSRTRLQEAALDLFEERGFEATTVAGIAEQAGLTKRTFFRHFADKREVLFSGSAMLEQRFSEAVERAPATASPLEAIGAGLDAAAVALEARRDVAPRRQAILDANPELQERERTKLASMATAAKEALRRRGVAEPTASLAAESGIVVLGVAFGRWVEDGGDLRELMRGALAELREL
jgi:AcrR family transcriptional regulator